MKPDWLKMKIEFINSNKNMPQLAEEYGVPLSSITSRAAKEGWTEARDISRQKTIQLALGANEKTRAEQLAEMNANDLRVAKLFAAKVESLMGVADTPADIKHLVAAQEIAQRVARLALGVATSKSELTGSDGKDLIPAKPEDASDDVLAAVAMGKSIERRLAN